MKCHVGNKYGNVKTHHCIGLFGDANMAKVATDIVDRDLEWRTTHHLHRVEYKDKDSAGIGYRDISSKWNWDWEDNWGLEGSPWTCMRMSTVAALNKLVIVCMESETALRVMTEHLPQRWITEYQRLQM